MVFHIELFVKEATMLRVYCAYCKKHLRDKDGHGVSGISHGICRVCRDKILAKHRDRVLEEAR